MRIASAIFDTPLPAHMAVFGEVGLGGEVRQVGHAPRRVTEAARLGFRRVIVPASSPGVDDDVADQVRMIRVSTLAEALRSAGLGGSGSSLRAI